MASEPGTSDVSGAANMLLIEDRPCLPSEGEGGGPFSLVELNALAEGMGRVRWRQVSDVAQVVANFARCHPRVREVRYPGLKSDPVFVEASQTLVGGFGPVVWCRLEGGRCLRITCFACDPRAACLHLEHHLLT